jgi:hypothetical protein
MRGPLIHIRVPGATSDVLLFFTCHLSENLRGMVNGPACDPGRLPAVLQGRQSYSDLCGQLSLDSYTRTNCQSVGWTSQRDFAIPIVPFFTEELTA